MLQGVSFTAEIGLTRVTGSSGIGKTTLLRILLGLERADGGATNADRFRWAAVFQEDRLLEQLDAAGNLRFALGAAYDEAAACPARGAGARRGGRQAGAGLVRRHEAPSGSRAPCSRPRTRSHSMSRSPDSTRTTAPRRMLRRAAAREKIVLLVSHEDDALTGAEVRLQ